MPRLLILFCALFALTGACAKERPATPLAIECEGVYPHHLQGVCMDDQEALFWSFTTRLVKTDRKGKLIREIPVANDHGDLCYHDGQIYVAVNLGRFNDPKGNADNWIYVYDAGDLSLRSRHPVPQVTHGAGGIAYHDGRFLVVGGLPTGVPENYVYEFDRDLRFIRKHNLPSGHTHLGIQTAAFSDGHWWFGCYGQPQVLLKADAALRKVERYEFDASLGIVPIGPGRFLVARGPYSREKGHTGRLIPAEADSQRGLALR